MPPAPQPQQDVLKQPLAYQGVVTQYSDPHPLGNGSFQNIFMNSTSFSLQTCAKGYTSVDPPPTLEDTFVPLGSPLQILCPSAKKIPRIPKEPP